MIRQSIIKFDRLTNSNDFMLSYIYIRIKAHYFLLGFTKKKIMIRQSIIKFDRLTNSNAFMLSYIYIYIYLSYTIFLQ